jgi:dipeptidyl aminopeptidase/acylaminoacyl peptidase
LAWLPEDVDPIVFAPDRRHFFVVTRRGILACDCVEMELRVYDMAAISTALATPERARHRPEPVAMISRRSAWESDFMPAIGEASWIDDQRILFTGVQDRGPAQVYILDVSTGQSRPITEAPARIGDQVESKGVLTYDWTEGGIVYIAPTDMRRAQRLARYPAQFVTDGVLDRLGQDGDEHWTYSVFAARGDNRPTRVASFTPDFMATGVWLSPSGDHAILAIPPNEMPAPRGWRGYDQGIEPGQLTRFLTLDLRTMRVSAPFDAPTGKAVSSGISSGITVAWDEDGGHAILFNTALPLDGDSARRSHAYIVDLDLQTGQWTIVTPLGAADAQAQSAASMRMVGNGLIEVNYRSLTDGALIERHDYRRADGRWIESPVSSPSVAHDSSVRPSSGVDVRIAQDADTPPTLVASNGTASITLTDPDPAVAGIWRARAHRVEWREADGRVSAGLLYLPRTYSSRQPPPLVIQAYYVLPQYFRPDGAHPTADAAQALVARGFAVLLMENSAVHGGETDKHVIGTRCEGPIFVRRIDAAVQALGDQHLIDPDRVGLIGFSRGGYQAFYAVSHPGRVHLAAAVVADSIRFDFEDYLYELGRSFHSGFSGLYTKYDQQYGGSFWENREAWLEDAPTFNADRIRTPTLFAYNNREQWPGALPVLGAYRRNNIPVEFLFFPRGSHQLVRPRERVASMNATIDWMSVWLMGADEPPSGDNDQFARWRRLRAQWTESHHEIHTDTSSNPIDAPRHADCGV